MASSITFCCNLQYGPVSPRFSTSRSLNSFTSFTFSGRPDLASLPKSCNLLGWDLGYSEATDQVRGMRASPVAAAWLSNVPCAPVHCLVVTRRSRQTPAIWQVTTVDSEAPNGVATVNFHVWINEYGVSTIHPKFDADRNHQGLAERRSICEH